MHRSNRDASLPNWLWFFLALPFGLIAVLLWQRRRVQSLVHRQVAIIRRSRYVEPDSIPIDTRPAFDMADMEEADQEEHAFNISEASLESMQAEARKEKNEVVPVQSDDLKLIEGIGPKISALLNEHGINSFQQLAEASLEHLNEILISANLRSIADPVTWAEQASLASSGEFEALKKLQETLKAGRRKE
jgi:predicted flap endonuclease-1-like 5' DNA nuclease